MQTVDFNTPASFNTQARFNMIEQQIRTWEVLDARVLDLLMQVPREAFVPEQYQGLAFADLEIPLGEGELMLAPKMEARILQALALKATDKVLEIGTGSGYLTALLAKQAQHVTSVEINANIAQQAAQRLAQQNISNISLQVGDAATGWAAAAPYDVIVFTGSLPVAPSAAQSQLKVGGRLFAVIGEAPVMQATMIRCIADNSFKRDVLFETCLPSLQHAPQPERFEF
jgi:protein-L-isoaspartate(D-aspartate) O-methyltransferase